MSLSTVAHSAARIATMSAGAVARYEIVAGAVRWSTLRSPAVGIAVLFGLPGLSKLMCMRVTRRVLGRTGSGVAMVGTDAPVVYEEFWWRARQAFDGADVQSRDAGTVTPEPDSALPFHVTSVLAAADHAVLAWCDMRGGPMAVLGAFATAPGDEACLALALPYVRCTEPRAIDRTFIGAHHPGTPRAVLRVENVPVLH